MNKIIGASGAAAALALTLVAGVGSAQAREPQQHFQQQQHTERYDPGQRQMAPQRDRGGNRTVIINNGPRYGGGWNYGGPVFIPVPVPVQQPAAVDQCTVDNAWGQVVAQDTWPYPNMNYSFQAGCSNGTGMWNGYTFYHNTVFE